LTLGRYIYVLGSGRTPVFVGIHELCNSSLRQTAQLNISEQYSRVNTEAVVFSMSIDIAYLSL